jgi:hypothetical protein
MPHAILVLAVFTIVACVPPHRADIVAPLSLPFPADTQRAEVVAPGVIHRFVYAATGPWAIHVLDVDRAACYSAVAVKGSLAAAGRKKTSAMLAELDSTGTVIGGVNADFFTPNGTPTNAHISRGRIVTTPGNRPLIAFDSAGVPRIGRLRAILLAGVDTIPLVWGWHLLSPMTVRIAGWQPVEAVGGRPILLRDGAVVPQVDTEGSAGFAASRHPRTAVGIASDGRRLLLVTVDGRQRPYSDGMTLRELANLMRALGARDAINLDGGGSTTMVVKTPAARAITVVNKPSDPTGERAVGNALGIVRGCAT